MNLARHWLLPQQTPRVLTSQKLKHAGVSPLRCVDLGKLSQDQAVSKAATLARDLQPAAIVAHNVRLACDSGKGARWGLTQEQIERLRTGETLTLEDSLGRFSIGYTRLDS